VAEHFSARGINPLTAYEILARVADERRTWKRILTSEDDRVVLQAMMFLTSMRDGKPAQQINVTSTSITLKAEDIARARAIVAEIRGEVSARPPALLSDNVAPTSPLQADDASGHLHSTEQTGEPMLSGSEGGEKGGRGMVEEVE
jgi:hypothetical protein